MKISCKQRNQGSTLFICLVACLIAGIVLASYLTLVSNRFNMSMRSKCWNEALPVLEAGIEEGMTHLHDDTNVTANGWAPGVVSGQTVYRKTRTFPDGSYYQVTLENATSTNPIIFSSGFVPAPNFSKAGYISRMVEVSTSKPKIFNNAIAATGPISMNGNAMVDSYSSCAGPYSAGNSLGTNGSIATDDQAAGSISLGNAQIYGTATTGSGGSVTYGPHGGVGDDNWNASHSGIESGWSGDTMNVSFPSNSPPTGGPFLAPPVSPVGGTNVTLLTGGNYQMSGFTSGGQPMFVTGPSVLYVTGNVNLSGTAYIQIFPGASLTLIVGGGTTAIAGQGVVNGTGIPANFSLLGLSSATNINYSGNADFVGTINAPQANFTLSGNASVYGAAIVNSFTGTGNGSLHYDSCVNAGDALVISSWVELL